MFAFSVAAVVAAPGDDSGVKLSRASALVPPESPAHEQQSLHDAIANGQCHTNGTACWPQYVLLGAQKAATTAVWQLLNDVGLMCNPYDGLFDVKRDDLWQCESADKCKESHFFVECGTADRCKSQVYKYMNLFRPSNCPSLRWMDATPMLNALQSPTTMAKLIPSKWMANMRFLAILREPISRDLSM